MIIDLSFPRIVLQKSLKNLDYFLDYKGLRLNSSCKFMILSNLTSIIFKDDSMRLCYNASKGYINTNFLNTYIYPLIYVMSEMKKQLSREDMKVILKSLAMYK